MSTKSLWEHQDSDRGSLEVFAVEDRTGDKYYCLSYGPSQIEIFIFPPTDPDCDDPHDGRVRVHSTQIDL